MKHYASCADLRCMFKYLNFTPNNKNVKSTLNIIKIMVLIKGYFFIFILQINK